MSVTPFYFLIVVLAVILVIRELQHARLEKQLLDRIMIQQGLEPLPEASILEGGTQLSDESPDVKRKLETALKQLDAKRKQERVTFRIPNMPAGMGDLTRGK